MAKIISTQSLKGVVEANIHAFAERVTGRHALLFKSAPSFVTYYSRDLAGSRSDANLGGAIEPIGVESPVRYHRIREFPIFGLSDADLSRAYDEVQGVTTNPVEGETFLLPGTIEPYENDYFAAEYLSTPLLFRVKEVQPERIEGKSFFRVTYFLDTSRDEEDILPQVTGKMLFELRNFGTEYRAVTEEEAAVLLRELSQLEQALRDKYWTAFYDQLTGTLLLGSHGIGQAVHDRYVEAFLRRNELFRNDAYRSARALPDVPYTGDVDPGVFDDVFYPMSIYWYSEQSEDFGASATNRVMLPLVAAQDEFNPLYFRFSNARKYAEVDIMPLGAADPAPVAQDYIGGSDLIAKVQADDFVDVHPIREIAKKSLGKYYRPADPELMLSRLTAFIEDINDSAIYTSRPDMFWLLPVVLMEAKLLRAANSAKTGE